MKRLLMAGFVAGILAVVAGPAGAQERDPFVPLVTPEEESGAAEGSGETGGAQPGSGPGPTQDVTSQLTEQMPETGARVSTWAGVAFALIAMGGGLLVLGRVMGWTRPPTNRSPLAAR